MQSVRLLFLDQLRVLAISLVVLVHYFPGTFPGASVGVSIFFVLSGYLVSTNILKSDLRGIRLVLKFYVERLFRIYPSLIFAFGTILFLSRLTGRPEFDELFSNAFGLFTFREIPIPSWYSTGIYWTLAVEVWFYIFLPVLFLLLLRTSDSLKIVLLSIIAFASFACLWGITAFEFFRNVLPLNSFSWIGHCLIGSIVAVVKSRNDKQVSLSMRTKSILRSLMIILIGLVAVLVSNEDRVRVWPIQSTIVCLLSGILIWMSQDEVADPDLPLITYFANLAYLIYLFHGIPLDFQSWIPDTGISFLKYSKSWLMILISIVAAVFVHHFIEDPFNRFGKKIGKKMRN